MRVRRMHNSFGERLKASRKAVRPKLTQEALAEAVGLTHGTISRLERGEIVRVSPELVAKLANAIGCDPGDLMSESKPAANPARERARALLDKIAAEDMDGAVKALRGFVRDEAQHDFEAAPKPSAKKAKRSKRG